MRLVPMGGAGARGPASPPDAGSRAISQTDLGCRLLSVTVASLGIVLTAPLMLVIGGLIKLTSPGPIMYTQPRIGADRRARNRTPENCRRRVNYCGRPFRIYKFRTMSAAVSGPGNQVWARPDDPRVTPLGRFLRKYRLDELPQMFNVLWGDMNIVGPRPEQPGIVMDLRERIERYDERHRVPPGITGWAQINQHYDSSIDDVRRKVYFDLEYVARRSAREDLKIMLRTLPVMLFQRGAW
jgi:lipopolysaccharide/colanic/teichoic acid biosynthesis glycosyltransferase